MGNLETMLPTLNGHILDDKKIGTFVCIVIMQSAFVIFHQNNKTHFSKLFRFSKKNPK